MAFLHCHSCDWEQDDFYSVDGYNPSSSLSNWNNSLCSPEIDDQFTSDAQFLRDHGPISTREVIARNYEEFARRIREMKWVTWEQYKAESDKVCPKCGSNNLDID